MKLLDHKALSLIGSIEIGDLNREVQRRLGYTRISKPLTQSIDKVLKKLIRNQEIEKEETKVMLQ